MRHLPLARHLARRYPGTTEREDVEQVACLGLLKAIDRFDPDRGLAFTTFAVPTILGEIKRYFRDQCWSVHVPRSLQELSARVDAANDALSTKLGRSATVEEIADWCEISAEEVVEALATRTAHRPDSLDRPAGEAETETILGLLPTREPGYEQVDDALDLSQLISRATGARAADRPAAVRRGPETAGDRRPRERLADARIAPVASRARSPAGRLDGSAARRAGRTGRATACRTPSRATAAKRSAGQPPGGARRAGMDHGRRGRGEPRRGGRRRGRARVPPLSRALTGAESSDKRRARPRHGSRGWRSNSSS